MPKKKSIFVIIVVIVVAITGLQSIIGYPERDSFVTDIIIEQYNDVGNLTVWNDEDNIYVTYQTTGYWYITETHLYLGKTDPSRLTNSPEQFPYSIPYKSNETTHSYVINLDDIDGYHLKPTKKSDNLFGKWVVDGNPGVSYGDIVFIAAHAVVCREKLAKGGLENLENNLPDLVNVSAIHSYPNSNQSYFEVIISGGTNLDGTYNGWCIDTDHNMNTKQYSAYVYTSNGNIPSIQSLEYPENLDLVNYILNQHFIGKPSKCDGNYTLGDVQLAIWTLVDDYVPTGLEALGPCSKCRVDEIVAKAIALGDGFIPRCGQVLAVILETIEYVGIIGQLAIVEVSITCEYKTQCETAWGNGTSFTGNNWDMYLTYTIQ